MADAPLRILVTNDDGIQSAGIAVLERVARTLSDDIWVCAPAGEQSGASHSLTLHRPVRMRMVSERRYTVDGTPSDCVLLAFNHLLEDRRPDLVLSGINHGYNLGVDIPYSGTIAAAAEATLQGTRAIALSQAYGPTTGIDWATAEAWAPDVIRRIIVPDWPQGSLVSVNFPDRPPGQVKGIRATGYAPLKHGDDYIERDDPRGRSYFWIGLPRYSGAIPADTDAEALDEGYIAVTPLQLDLTHQGMIGTLRQALS